MNEADRISDIEDENMAQECWETEIERELQHFRPAAGKLTIRNCADLISRLTKNGREALEEHLQDYDDVLLHIFASEHINEPLLSMLGKNPLPQRSIENYCKVIEIMWQYGDEAVVNVVDVTILERLSYEDALWQRFGGFISEEFKEYINKDVLTYNLMMGGVRPLA